MAHAPPTADQQRDDQHQQHDDAPKKNHKKYRRDKPIDHWKVEEFKPGDMKHPLLEESSFATLFPKYREKYLREVWPQVTTLLKALGLACRLDLVEGSMTVSTTRKTWDPFVVLKARDLLKLLARSVPLPQAQRVLQDDCAADIIKIDGLCASKDRFVKRRARLLGPNGATLKALELLTGCYVLVQGNTVAAMGPHKGLKQVRNVVVDCMRNVHPIYNIKTLMIKRELAKDPALATENWDRFLPKFKKQSAPKKKLHKVSAAKQKRDEAKSPFPPAPTPSKLDQQLESGEYFLTEAQRKRQKQDQRRAEAANGRSDRQAQHQAQLLPPPERAPTPAAATGSTAQLAARLAARPAPDASRKRAATAPAAQDFVLDMSGKKPKSTSDSKKR